MSAASAALLVFVGVGVVVVVVSLTLSSHTPQKREDGKGREASRKEAKKERKQGM